MCVEWYFGKNDRIGVTIGKERLKLGYFSQIMRGMRSVAFREIENWLGIETVGAIASNQSLDFQKGEDKWSYISFYFSGGWLGSFKLVSWDLSNHAPGYQEFNNLMILVTFTIHKNDSESISHSVMKI